MHKTCNLCAGTFPLFMFPSSGDRVKPYCATCTPLVRRGIQAGLKVAAMRQVFQQEGLSGVRCLVGADT